MSVLTEARTALHMALVGTFATPVGSFTFDGRVDRTQPAKLAAPRVWVGDSSGVRTTAGNTGSRYVATFDVWVAYDGAVAAQVEGVDEVIGRVHDAAVRAEFDVTGHTPSSLPPELFDSTKPNVRASVVSIERTMRALTLCTPPQP